MSEEGEAEAADFLGATADNRISIAADPDRWEGLDDDDRADSEPELAPVQRHLRDQPQPSVRGSGEAENESYRVFLTQREQQRPPEMDKDEEDDEERYIEQLGSRLVTQPPSGSDPPAQPEEEREDHGAPDAVRGGSEDSRQRALTDRPKPSAPQSESQQPPPSVRASLEANRNFSVRKGGQQLANLLPQPPPPPPQRQLQQPPPRQASPSVPQEVHAGYLSLDSGHVLGPFRWSVDEVTAPASLHEGASSRRDRQAPDLFMLLTDGGGPEAAGRQRFLTRRGRLSFVDPSTGEAVPLPQSDDSGSSLRQNLLELNRGLAALSSAGGAPHPGAVDEDLTRILARTLAANGASLMVASTNPIESLRDRPSPKPASVDASVVARSSTKSDEPDDRQDLERLVRALRSQVDSLKLENSGLRDRLKAADQQLPQPPASASSSTNQQQQQQQRPMSKSSYQSLYEMLQEYMQENENLRTENLGLVKTQGDRLREQDLLAKENRRLAERLNRMQKQQQQQQQQQRKPLYVVSNPDSRASSNHQGRLQQQQQELQQASTAASAVTSTTDSLLPPIPMPPEPQQQQQQQPRVRQAFPTPPVSQQLRQSPQSLTQQQQHWQQQQQLRQQRPRQQRPGQQQQQQQQPPQFYYAPSSDSDQNGAYNNYYFYGQPPLAPQFMQPLQQLPPPPPPLPPPQPPANANRQPHPAVAMQTESPLYVPKPGEATYRGRFRQANGNAGKAEQQRRRAAADAGHAVQDVNRMNESLKTELRELDGAIQQHQRVNALQSDIRRNEGRKVLKTF